jgi:hypothetical protein
MKHYKEYRPDTTEIMCVTRMFPDGKSIVIYPNCSVHEYTYNEIGNTHIPCTFQEFEIIRKNTFNHLSQ